MASVARGKPETEIMTDAQNQKAVLRSQVRAILDKMSVSERADGSLQVCYRLEQQAIWRDAKSILFYAPLPEEPDIWKLLEDAIAAGKQVLLPRFVPEHNHYVACHIRDAIQDVKPGKFGVREPLAACEKILLNQLDLILVPGLAFDLDGRRLGRGKGFYDRLLGAIHGPTCGVAFDQQIVSPIPVEPHDMRLSFILTPTRWQCEQPRAVLK